MEEAILTGETDDIFLQTAEDELIDDYLLRSLTQEERRGFEEQFLITEERKQRLRFASALIEYSQKTPTKDNSRERRFAPPSSIRGMFSWRRATFLGAAASVLLAVLSGWELLKLRQQTQVAQETRNELTRLQAATAGDNRRAAQVVEPSTGIPGRMPVIEFASATRSVYPVVFRIPAEAIFARIDWKLSAPFAQKYREVLLSGSGQQLWMQEFPAAILAPAQRSTIVLPAYILVPGIYHLRLDRNSANGQFKESDDCVFRVVKD